MNFMIGNFESQNFPCKFDNNIMGMAIAISIGAMQCELLTE